MRSLVIGDIHGAHKALIQCLERSKFDYENDELICLGDIVDGWTETKQCFDELLKIKNLIFILGNHDKWFLDFIQNNRTPDIWLSQGGRATLESYGYDPYYFDGIERVPIQHKKLLENAYYYMEDEKKLFVHGGIDRERQAIDVTPRDTLLWDRNTFYIAQSDEKLDTVYDEIYIGHSTTSRFSDIPIERQGVWMMDQGGGWEGKLSILDVETKEFWQSDKVSTLYPNIKGRD